MRFGLDTSTLRFRHTGIAVYTQGLIRELQNAIGPHECLVAFDGLRFHPIEQSWCNDMVAANEARVLAQDQRSVTLHQGIDGFVRGGSIRRLVARRTKEALFTLGQSQFDVFHAIVTLPPGRTHKPLIPLVHDVSILRFPETHPKERLRTFDRWLPALAKASVINTVSAFSKAEIVATLGVPADRIVVTLPGIDPFFRSRDTGADAEILRHLNTDGRAIILLVGSIEPRKNIAAALTAFSRLPPATRAKAVLLVVGGYGWGELKIAPEVAPIMSSGAIRFTGYVSRLTLRALYRNAALLVFPSLYEGFGLPAAEAMACGTAVAVSRGTSLQDVVGPHGELVDSGDIEAWSEKMKQAVERGTADAEARALRQEWSLKYDWQKNAATTLAMYRAVASGAERPVDLV
jgi:glycosyltransferase involved in cell wall biosynthesis